MQAIYRAVRKGHLPTRPYGPGRYLIRRADLDDYDRNRSPARASVALVWGRQPAA